MAFGLLGIGASGVNAAQKALEVISHNLANVNTEGYSRQRAELVTAPPREGVWGARGGAWWGTGVELGTISRIRDAITDSTYRSSLGTKGSWDTKAQYASRTEQILGPLDGGMPSALSQFWGAWDDLSLHPEEATARTGVMEAGERLARWLRNGATQLDSLQREIVAATGETVSEVNTVAKQMADLNRQIAAAVNGNNAPNDLLDQRDRLADRLAELTGSTAVADENGNLNVFIGSMAIVRGINADTLVASNPPLAVTWQPGGQTPIVGGRLGGLIPGATKMISDARQQLDAIAVGLRDLINTAHAAGLDLDGNPGGTFFVGADASQIAVDPALTVRGVAAALTAAPTDGNNALAIAGLRSAVAVNGMSLGAAIASFAGNLGRTAADSRTNQHSSEVAALSLAAERASVASVSIDEEMTNMIRYQRAYEASARVITAVDEMLDQLINRTGLVGR